MFLALIVALAAVVAALVIVPLWRERGAWRDDTRHDQLRRFDELEADVAAGDVDAATAPLIRAELEHSVLAAVDHAPPPAHGGSRRALAAVVLVTLLAAVPLYQHLGAPHIGAFKLAHPERDLSEPRAAVELLLEQVRARTRAAPADREAWTVLARSTLALGRFDEALAAAERVHALAPADAQAKLLLVDALAMQAGGRFGDRARTLLAEVLEHEPDHPTALVLDGIAAEQAGARARAMARWRRALEVLPPDAPFRAEVESMLGNLVPAASAPAATDAAEADAADAPAPVRIEVAVSLAPALAREQAAQLPADTPVFVIARAVDGPRAPLAVARHRLHELPLITRLDDRMAMLEDSAISDFERIYVVARIAVGGSASARAGDLEGRSAPFAPTAEGPVEVVIDAAVE